jgi:hypothetical protein
VEIFLFMAGGFAVTFFLIAVNEISKELRGIRTVMETHYELEPIPVRAERTYKRKGVEL